MSASVERIEGVLSADLNFASGTLLVEYAAGSQPLAQIVRVVESTGHGVQSLEAATAGEPQPERPWLDRHRAEIATVGSGVLLVTGAALMRAGTPEWIAIGAYATAIAFGGLLVWRRALVSLQARILDMNVLMTVAVFGAAALGEWGEGATVYFLFALGGLLEARSLERTRRSIRDLMALTPPTALVRRGSETVEIPAEEIVAGDAVVIRPGARVPVDGVVSVGASAFDEAAITGESIPAEKAVGDRVFAGTLNASGLVEIVASGSAGDSTLSRIVYLVEEAQASRAPSQAFIDRFSRVYTPVVIALAAVIAVLVPGLAALLGIDIGSWSEWVRRGLVMLVVSCPCALVISTPVSIVSAITRASRDGVLVKGGAFIESAARVRAVAFDKTGTLTYGRPEVAEVVSLGHARADEVLAIAGALESHSDHPIARAVVRAAGAGAHPGAISDFEEIFGRGVSGSMGGVRYDVCSPSAAAEGGRLDSDALAAVDAIESRGRTVLVVLAENRATGLIGVADAVRDDAPAAVEKLSALGIEHLVMLTGDNERVAEEVAESAGVTGYLARLLPEAKTDAVRVLRERYGTVAMVGDGVNDAPALAAADIGIAMGAAGTDTALETADVALMRDDLAALPGFFALAKRTVGTIRVNVAFSIAVKAIFLALALTGRATLWMAVFADTGVSLLVILNGMRLLRRR